MHRSSELFGSSFQRLPAAAMSECDELRGAFWPLCESGGRDLSCAGWA